MKIKQKKSAASFKDLSTDGIVLLKTKHSFEPRNCVTVTLELHNFIAGSPKRETVLFCLNCSTCVCVCVCCSRDIWQCMCNERRSCYCFSCPPFLQPLFKRMCWLGSTASDLVRRTSASWNRSTITTGVYLTEDALVLSRRCWKGSVAATTNERSGCKMKCFSIRQPEGLKKLFTCRRWAVCRACCLQLLGKHITVAVSACTFPPCSIIEEVFTGDVLFA